MGLSVCGGLVVSSSFLALAKFHPLNEKNAEGETNDFSHGSHHSALSDSEDQG